MNPNQRLLSRRRPLIEGQTAVYHIISRTTCKQFLLQDKEKEVFRRMLHRHARFHGVEILTYCILSNHFHLLVRIPHNADLSDNDLLERYRSFYSGPNRPFSAPTPEVMEANLTANTPDAEQIRQRLKVRMGNLPIFMRELKQCFAIWYNRTHQNHGTIWASRYKSLIVEDAPEALTTVAAYIDLNPVRAGITNDPGNYRWCGYAEAVGGSHILRMGLCSLLSGRVRDWTHALTAYRIILFGKGRKAKGDPKKDHGRIAAETANSVQAAKGRMSIDEILRHRIRYFTDGMALGSHGFLEKYFEANRDRFSAKRKSGARKMKGADWGELHVMRNLKVGSDE